MRYQYTSDRHHYTLVLPVLFLSGGRHLLQDEFTICGILGFTNQGILENSTVKITPVGDILEKMPSSRQEQNRQNQGIMVLI